MRNPQPGRAYYWARFDGRCHNLGENLKDARQELHRLLAERTRTAAAARTLTAFSLTEKFLDWSQAHQPKTYAWYALRLKPWMAWLIEKGHHAIPAAEVRPLHVTEWLTWIVSQWKKADALPKSKRRRRGKGGDGERHNLIRAVQRVWNWAVKEQHIDASRLAKIEKPTAPTRKYTFPEATFRAIFDAADPAFREYLTVLTEQGCRPGEARAVEVRHIDLAAGTWTFPADEHKTGQRTRRDRVIYLTPATLELSRRLVALRKSGHLLRNSDGDPWSKNAVCLRFQRLREKFDLPEGAVAHALRHTFVTLARTRGLDAATVAQLLGHTDSRMVERTYSHLDQHTAWLREQAAKAAGS